MQKPGRGKRVATSRRPLTLSKRNSAGLGDVGGQRCPGNEQPQGRSARASGDSGCRAGGGQSWGEVRLRAPTAGPPAGSISWENISAPKPTLLEQLPRESPPPPPRSRRGERSDGLGLESGDVLCRCPSQRQQGEVGLPLIIQTAHCSCELHNSWARLGWVLALKKKICF